MAQAMRDYDWSSTPLGDPSGWPAALTIPLRMLLTSRFEMWLGWGPDLQFFYNDAYIPTLGIKHTTALGQPFRQVWSEVYDDVSDQVELVRTGQASWNKSLLLLLERSGYPEETYHSFSYSPLFEADGSVAGLLCVVTEDTARIISERRLETLRKLGLALAGVTAREAVRDPAIAALGSNQYDFPFVALRFINEQGPDSSDMIWNVIRATLAAQIDAHGSIIALPTNGPWPCGGWDRSPSEAVVIPIADPLGGTDFGTLVLGLNPYRAHDADVLDFARLARDQIGGALANVAALDSERRRADRIWSVSRDLMVVVDPEGVFRSVSPSWTRILGHPTEDVVGRRFADFMHPDDVASGYEALSRALGENLNNYENRFRAADGNYRRVEWHTTLEDDLVFAYGRDVTDRRQVEEALNNSQEQFRHLVQGVTDYAIYMIDLEGYVSSWNEGARHIKGYEPDEIIGEHFSRFYTDEDRQRGEPGRALETARAEGRFLAEGWRVRKDGERFRASVVIDAIRDDFGKPIGFAKITRDITEKERTQKELEQARENLFQSQKMDAIGQLTGGVAHDFNNLLTAVLGSLELLRKRLPPDPSMLRLIDNAIEGGRRGATLTQRMLAFARRQELTVDRVDLPRLLSGMSDLVQRSIGPEWPISTRFPLKLPLVQADANQLEMALLNLIVNARDASPGGGSILISATCEELSTGMVNSLQSGSYVRLVVQDQGGGMDAETLRRATEPFFTTKGVGKGTGLGLPMVHGMAQQIGGTFELISKIQHGTSAVLWLPAAGDDTTSPQTTPVPAAAPAAPKAKILAVDDDALVLMNTVALLEDLGHEVIEASNGQHALELFRSNTDIELIITDQAMPKMTGSELITAVEKIRPGVISIIASGYGEGLTSERRQGLRLSKPFTQNQLANVVAEALKSP